MLLEEKRKRKRDGDEEDPIITKNIFLRPWKSLAEEKMYGYGIFKERVTQRCLLHLGNISYQKLERLRPRKGSRPASASSADQDDCMAAEFFRLGWL